MNQEEMIEIRNSILINAYPEVDNQFDEISTYRNSYINNEKE